MNRNFLKSRSTLYILLAAILVGYLIFKAFDMGNDINVYLYASRQLFRGENIYTGNPFNDYLYSPLFALLLRPVSILDYGVARIVWAVINLVLALRLWKILLGLIRNSLNPDERLKQHWTVALIILSLGFLNHNLILGQTTVLILWLTLEGLYQIQVQNRPVLGAALLALGINIKITPLIGLFYLFFKWKFKALSLCAGFILISIFLPSLFVGHSYNMKMVEAWGGKINPKNSKYVLESSTGTQSLNAILPAYFYDFDEEILEEEPIQAKRLIIPVAHDTLVLILQILRVMLLLSCLLLIFHNYRRQENHPLYFYWEFAYLILISVLIFPHQQKYAMLYFVPAGSWMILYILLLRAKGNIRLRDKIIAVTASLLMLLMVVMGRDIVGDHLVNLFDYYHVWGLINIVFLFFLFRTQPDRLTENTIAPMQ